MAPTNAPPHLALDSPLLIATLIETNDHPKGPCRYSGTVVVYHNWAGLKIGAPTKTVFPFRNKTTKTTNRAPSKKDTLNSGGDSKLSSRRSPAHLSDRAIERSRHGAADGDQSRSADVPGLNGGHPISGREESQKIKPQVWDGVKGTIQKVK